MSFPAEPRDIVTEIYAGDGWRDISTDVRVDSGVTITRGRRNEGGAVDPSSCALKLDNSSGDYSPRNPMSAYYGTLGRNTPIRVSIRHARDTFARTVSGSWGTADTGQVWAQDGAGGTVQASDFNVTSGTGTHLVPVANAQRFTYLSTLANKDLEVAVTVSLPFSNVTGGGIFPASIIFRAPDVSNYYMVRVGITTTEQIQMSVVKTVNNVTTQVGSTVTTALTVTGQSLRVRAHVEGSTLRGKVWPATDPEPIAWAIEAEDDTLTTPGWVGIRSEVATGNTNTPVTFSYDDLQITLPRFNGEVTEWPTKWDISGRDVTAPIEAAGIMRRLGQGASPLRSTLRRSIPTLPNLVAYWPCEDGENATQVSSGLTGGQPGLFHFSGYPDWAGYSGFACSEPLPVLRNARWDGQVNTYNDTGVIQIRFVLYIPAGAADLSPLIQLWTFSGDACLWELRYLDSGGSGDMDIAVFAPGSGTPAYQSGGQDVNVNGRPVRVQLQLAQSGGNVNWELSTLQPGFSGGGFSTGTVVGRTLGRANTIVVGAHRNLDNVTIGHVSVENATSSLFTLADELAAFDGEAAGSRIQRLCTEEGIPFSDIGSMSATAKMGPQRPKTILDLIREAESADGGTLFEPRGTLGLAYRTLTTITNQPARLAASYGHLSPPFEPTDDDQGLRNDVTVRRPGGSEVRAQQTTGPLSVSDPPTGVGRYDTSVELNVRDDAQALHAATWLVHVGTVDEARYPTVTVNLASSSVAALESQVLDVSIDDRVTITGLPSWLPPGPVSVLMGGYTERIGPYEHTLTAVCSPASPYEVLQLDTDKLDTAGSKLVTAVTSGATSFTVARTGDYDEGFEDATYDLNVTGTWTRTNAQAHSGSWSLRSAAIGDSQQSDCVITVPEGADTLQFWFRVSTESGFDFFRLYIDSTFWGEASGSIGWTQSIVYPVAGASTVTFRYIKDVATAAGDDAVYIDDVQFRSSAPLWTTTDEPVSLVIGGEEVTATTITGSTSPQTMTVTRSVNGISKAHPAGAEIRLKTPATLALG